MLVQEFLERTADCLPGKTGLIAGGKRLTYAEIEQDANRLANALIVRGVQRGDRVILFLPNGVEAVLGIFATLKAGAVFVVVNPTTKSPKLAYIANNCQARAIFMLGKQAEAAQALLEQVPSLQLVVLTSPLPESTLPAGMETLGGLLAQHTSQRPHPPVIDLDLACLIYTSGSTGEPKGVMCDHSSVDFASSAIIQYLQNTPQDIVLNVLPLSFDYGLYQLLMVFKFGGTLVLEKGFAFPAHILKRMEAEKVTGLPGVPTIFTLLLQMDLAQYDLRSLRYLTNTAAVLPVGQIQQIRGLFPWAALYSMYGLTETKRTLYLPPEELDRHPDSVGVAIPGTEVWLEDENGRHLGPGEVGELVIRGRHVMRGYWNDPAATAQRFRPGAVPGERLCYSGDLFRMDENGLFYFVARKDDVIKSRGEKVSPLEIERVLYQLDGVVEAAVIGVPDPVLGQAIKAFIVARSHELDTQAVLRHCRASLEDYLIPKFIEFRAELPKTTSGKISKNGLA